MKAINVSSPAYRAFAAGAILSDQRHILEQLKEARESGKPCIRLIENFYDDLRYSSIAEPASNEYIIITGEAYYNALCRLEV